MKAQRSWAIISDLRFRKLVGVGLRGSQRVLGIPNLAKRGKPCSGWSFWKLREKRRASSAGQTRIRACCPHGDKRAALSFSDSRDSHSCAASPVGPKCRKMSGLLQDRNVRGASSERGSIARVVLGPCGHVGSHTRVTAGPPARRPLRASHLSGPIPEPERYIAR
jgi:hypothetical protein